MSDQARAKWEADDRKRQERIAAAAQAAEEACKPPEPPAARTLEGLDAELAEIDAELDSTTIPTEPTGLRPGLGSWQLINEARRKARLAHQRLDDLQQRRSHVAKEKAVLIEREQTRPDREAALAELVTVEAELETIDERWEADRKPLADRVAQLRQVAER
jgi:hypothetical protein